MSLHELEDAVAKLPHEDLKAFAGWFEEYLADEWDRQIEADAAVSKLDAAAKSADRDFGAGRCTLL